MLIHLHLIAPNWVSKWMLWLNVAPCCRYRGGKPTRAHLPHDRLLQRPLQDCQVRPSPLPHWVNTSWPAGPQVPYRHRSGREPEECEREHRLARLCRVWKLGDHETSHRVRGQVISWIYWWPNFFLQMGGNDAKVGGPRRKELATVFAILSQAFRLGRRGP